MTNENFADKGQRQIKDKILIKDIYSDKRQVTNAVTMTNTVTKDFWLTENKILTNKELHKVLLLHIFLTRRRLHFKDAGHLTKASHTL